MAGIAFQPMPRAVAVGSAAGGALVVGFGVLLLFVSPEATQAQGPVEPVATLEPVDPDDPRPEPARGVYGLVTTPDDEPAAGTDVFLVPLFDAKTLETQTDDKGAFAFEDVRVNPGARYVAEASFDGVRFPSSVLRTPRSKKTPVELVVAPTTKSADDLEVRIESMALVGDDSALQAVHALNVNNRGKRAYVGKLELPLLRGAAAIQEGAGLDRRTLDLQQNPPKMTSRAPIVPGSHDLTYTYASPMSSEGIAFERTVTVPTERYELLIAGDLEVAGARGLRDDGEAKIGPKDHERTYHRYVATNLDAGDEIGGRIEVAKEPDLVRIGAPIAAVVVALVVLLVPLLRRRRRATPEPQTT